MLQQKDTSWITDLNSYRDKDKRKSENIQAFQELWKYQQVTGSTGDRIGIITELKPDDEFPEVMVKWENGVEIPEQPSNLSPVIDSIEGLTYDESRQLLLLERKIEKSFWEAGNALKIIRDNGLHKHLGTFQNYCEQRFRYKPRYCYYLIESALTFEVIQEHNAHQGAQKLPIPTTEKPLRPLGGLDPKTKVSIWSEAVKESLGRLPTSDKVKQVASRFKKRIKMADSVAVGNVYQLTPKDNEDLSGLSGVWAIVEKIGEFSCQVKTYLGTHQAFVENIKDFDPRIADKIAYQKLLERLVALDFEALESTAQVIVKAIARINRTVDSQGSLLTDFEEMALQLIESTEIQDKGGQ